MTPEQKKEIGDARKQVALLGAKIEEQEYLIGAMTRRQQSLAALRENLEVRLGQLTGEAQDVHAPRGQLLTPEEKRARELRETEKTCLTEMLKDCPSGMRTWLLNGYHDQFGTRNIAQLTTEQLQAARHTLNKMVGNGPGRIGLFANMAADYYEREKARISREVMAWEPKKERDDGDGGDAADSGG